MHLSNEEKKALDKIEKNLSEIESSSKNIQQEREKVQRLTEEILKEGVELIKVSDKLSEISSILHADKSENTTSSEPVSIRKDHFPYNPQDYITGSYRVSDFSYAKGNSKNASTTAISESLGSRKSRPKAKVSSNKSTGSKKKKRRVWTTLLPVFVFILILSLVLLSLDVYYDDLLPFIDVKKLLEEYIHF